MADAVELRGCVDALGVAEWLRRDPARHNFVVAIVEAALAKATPGTKSGPPRHTQRHAWPHDPCVVRLDAVIGGTGVRVCTYEQGGIGIGARATGESSCCLFARLVLPAMLAARAPRCMCGSNVGALSAMCTRDHMGTVHVRRQRWGAAGEPWRMMRIHQSTHTLTRTAHIHALRQLPHTSTTSGRGGRVRLRARMLRMG